MDIETVLETLGISESLERLRPHWETSLLSYAPAELLGDAEQLAEIADYCGLREAEIETCQRYAKIISESKALSFLFHHISTLIFDTPDYENANFKNYLIRLTLLILDVPWKRKLIKSLKSQLLGNMHYESTNCPSRPLG